MTFSVDLDAIQAMQSEMDALTRNLPFLTGKAMLEAKRVALRELGQDPALSLPELGNDAGTAAIDPDMVKHEAAELASLMAKLKFHYTEQRVKNMFVNALVSDPDAFDLPTAEDNEALEAENTRKKAALKEAKRKLEQTSELLEKRSREVTEQYERAQAATMRNSALARQIIDTRLQLTRLRRAYPQPRLTTETAEALMEEQIGALQAAGDALDANRAAATKRAAQLEESSREAERLIARRAEIDREVRALRKRESENAGGAQSRVAEEAAWYSACIALQRALSSITHFERVNNELHVAYQVRPRNGGQLRTVEFRLIFNDGLQTLQDAEISGVTIGYAPFVEDNDPVGLVKHALHAASVDH